MAQDRDIKYTGRTFTDFKTQLEEFAKNYFPDTYNDFSPTSPGTMFMEMAAYVGDVLAFYQDTQLQETYLQYAKNPANLYNLAYMMGYRPKVTSAAEVDVEVIQIIDATLTGEPDWSQALQIGVNTVLSPVNTAENTFIIDQPIDFATSSSYSPTEVTVAELDGTMENPTKYQLVKTVKATAGTIKTVTEQINGVEKFKTITLEDSDIIGILSIEDSSQERWYEVPFLGQDTILQDVPNLGADKGEVPNILVLQTVPKRFTTRFTSTGALQIQFGSGIANLPDTQITPDPTNVGLGHVTGISRLDFAYDPTNFLHTQTYGLAPSQTTLTITYLVGGGITSNIPANTLTNIESINIVSGTGTPVFNNPKPATGGKDGDTVEELRQNALRAFNEQGRIVTKQDYVVRALSLPSKYGTVAKVHVEQDQLKSFQSQTDNIIDSNPLGLTMYTLAYDNNRNLIKPTNNLRENLKKYLARYMMITDALTFRDAFIINIEVNFDIIARPNFLGRDVLIECTQKLKEHFNITNWSINQPINISSIFTLLDQVKGVQTVQKVEIVNKVGGDYSQFAYDIKGATRNNIVYPSLDPCIFEVKFPDTDIKGRITTL